MRVKLPKKDVDEVFDYLDADGDCTLNYKEFCGFAEEKRRGIDPFESNNDEPKKRTGLNESALQAFQKNPYSNLYSSPDA
jgi:hypothetical protein